MNRVEERALDLAWSLWTELGVPGLVENHKQHILDPEAILVGTAWLVKQDARLRDLVLGWCKTNARHLSTSRVRALLSSLPPDQQKPLIGLARAADVPWFKGTAEVQPWPSHAARPIHLDISRPSMLAFRIRGLCGIGTRADVILVLLLDSRWRSASHLTWLGYSKRNIADVLVNLSHAGVVRHRSRGNRVEYQINKRKELAAVVAQAGGPGTPTNWMAILDSVRIILQLSKMTQPLSASKRVMLADAYADLNKGAGTIGWSPPPHGAKTNLDLLLDWGRRSVEECALGRWPG